MAVKKKTTSDDEEETPDQPTLTFKSKPVVVRKQSPLRFLGLPNQLRDLIYKAAFDQLPGPRYWIAEMTGRKAAKCRPPASLNGVGYAKRDLYHKNKGKGSHVNVALLRTNK